MAPSADVEGASAETEGASAEAEGASAETGGLPRRLLSPAREQRGRVRSAPYDHFSEK